MIVLVSPNAVVYSLTPPVDDQKTELNPMSSIAAAALYHKKSLGVNGLRFLEKLTRGSLMLLHTCETSVEDISNPEKFKRNKVDRASSTSARLWGLSSSQVCQ
jgi:hypothetical protein